MGDEIVHGESEVLPGSLRILLISIFAGCKKSAMCREGNCFLMKDLTG